MTKLTPKTWLVHKRRVVKTIAMVLVLTMLFQMAAPITSYALTSGPSQPEISQFQPVGVTDMVDPFTGDFGYNIPLIELPGPNGGYPFNLSYQSGITMDQEASWVGLGWNVNAGSIVRNMRSLPDEFNGKSDMIKRKMNRKKNETYGAGLAVSFKFTGADFKKLNNSAVTLSVGFKVYNNTYNGIGYGIDLGTSFAQNSKDHLNAGVGFNLSLDSQEGVGANANASLSNKNNDPETGCYKKNDKQISLGIGFHSSGGLNGAISGSVTKGLQEKDANGALTFSRTTTLSGSTPISFAVPSHTPSMGFEMKSRNFTGSLSMGGAINSLYTHFNVSGFYSVSKLDKTQEDLPAYGYMHLQNQAEGNAMTDFNREKDGAVYKTSTNLASPSLTYDYYLVNGQGAGGMFRPYRQDYGHVHEQERTSIGMGGSFGFDMSIPPLHFGISGSFNYSKSRTGDWKKHNDARQFFNFRKKGYSENGSPDHRYEGAYFKMAGEAAAVPLDELNNIGGENPVNLIRGSGHSLDAKLNVFNASAVSGTSTLSMINSAINLAHTKMRREKRTPRSTVIYPVTNRELMPSYGTFNEVLGEYDIEIKKPSSPSFTYSNLTSSQYSSETNARGGVDMINGDHPAGMTVLQPDGKRYVYALPAYNNSQVQETFSVPAQNDPTSTVSFQTNSGMPSYKHASTTNEYHERVEIPRYAHSYLLTSVLGDDYVDADHDTKPGPSDGDYGYWVKFNYVKTSDAFKWRTPISGASYQPGEAGSSVDDMGTYTYGTKEIWYLASAETKTHILIFEMSPRLDGYGPAAELNNLISAGPPVDLGNRLYKLDKIKLYSKEELAIDKNTEPIQTVHFGYEYLLCKNTANSKASQKAKLTLTKIYFTHKYDRSGMLSPYEFEYDAENNNPDYNFIQNKYDRWGTYRSMDYGGGWANQEFPYTPQFDRTQVQDKEAKEEFKEMTDKNASAWHLIAVKLPSGAKMKVEYESDDYAYVQHRKAAQMFQIEGVGNEPDGEVIDNTLFESDNDFWGDRYNSNDDEEGGDVSNSKDARRIYFQLENPIPTSMSPADARLQIIREYLDCIYDKANDSYTKPFFAKLKVNLRGDIDEYISGYYFAQLSGDGMPDCGTGEATESIDGVTSYKYGYFTVDFTQIEGEAIYHHPFAVASWQHMRINLPRVLTASGDFTGGTSNMEHMTQIGSLASWANTIRTMFTGYRKFCYDKQFADQLNLSESFVRLSTPDGFKFGGGSRVKKLYVEDDPIWGDDKIGQVYDYTLPAGRSGFKPISSGVASYEPIVGGEENILHTAKFNKQAIPFFTDNNLFYEFPINESYYPAPRVGYSRITVTSLNTANVEKMVADGEDPDTYMGIQTTGKTVNEFYTAKDFPTITGETTMTPHSNPYIIPLPFIGMIQVNKLTATQGYSILLNDMHGKPKKVSTYASVAGGGFTDNPITSVSYYYKTEPFVYEGEQVHKLNNKVDVLVDDPQMLAKANAPVSGLDKAKLEKMYVGMEYDFFADFRHSTDEAGTGGLDFNMDIMGAGAIGFPLPFPWPSFNFSHTSTRLAVTNKIIQNMGLIDSVVATDGQSTVSTKNLVYDKYTGEPLLTTVNNNYDNQVYNYAYPAYMAYESTGPAYEDILFEFTGKMTPAKGGWTIMKEDLTTNPAQYNIGSNVGMGHSYKEIANSQNKITYDKLYDYLNEGDEFIAEFYKYDLAQDKFVPGSKFFAVLKEKRLGVSYVNCGPEKLLVFDYPYNNITYKIGQPIRLLLVRSGKRNLLNMKTGAIQSLMDISAGTDLLEGSPIFKREKIYSAGSVAPDLYDSLTYELKDFLKNILDCDGRLPVGQYYMDDPRFIKSDGTLLYENLSILLETIRVDDICGAKQDCYETEATGTHPARWTITCKSGCNKQVGGDYYSPIFKCNEGLPNPSVAAAMGQALGGCGSPSNHSCIEAAYNAAHPCHILHYEEEGPTYSCVKGECLDCMGELGKDVKGKPIRKGYHLVLKFRQPFATSLPCITTHCLATARYKPAGTIVNTAISNITVESGHIIRFHYSQNLVSTTDFCMDEYEFTVPSTFYSIKNVLSASAVELSQYKTNAENYKKVCGSGPTPIVNMYVTGLKGIWRPAKTYYYNDERYQGQKPSTSAHMTSMLDLSSDGVFDGNGTDKKFILFNWTAFLPKKVHEKWQPNETVTAFTPNSLASEARDVLGIYSSVLFDKHGMLPVAVGKNARKTEMVYENFDNTEVIAWNENDDFDNNGTKDYLQVQVIHAPFTGYGSLSTKTKTRYVFDRTQFIPNSSKSFILSLWAGGFNTLYSPAECDARFGNIMNVRLYFYKENGDAIPPSSTSNIGYLEFKPTGKIFEGGGTFWRKIEATFTPPTHAYKMAIEFGTTGFSNDGSQMYGTMYQMVGTGNVFLDQRACFDDVRIFPSDALMSTYVYDTYNYRLVAEGDENNYPSLYGYSPSGSLMLVKKLTEEGLKTLKEVRANTKRNPKPLPGNIPIPSENE